MSYVLYLKVYFANVSEVCSTVRSAERLNVALTLTSRLTSDLYNSPLRQHVGAEH